MKLLPTRSLSLAFFATALATPLLAATGNWTNADVDDNFWNNDGNWSAAYPGTTVFTATEWAIWNANKIPANQGDAANLPTVLAGNQTIDLNGINIGLQNVGSQAAIRMTASHDYRIEGAGTLRIYGDSAANGEIVNTGAGTLFFGPDVQLVLAQGIGSFDRLIQGGSGGIVIEGSLTSSLDAVINNRTGLLRFAGSGQQLFSSDPGVVAVFLSNDQPTAITEFSNPDFMGGAGDLGLLRMGNGTFRPVGGNDRINVQDVYFQGGFTIDADLIITNNLRTQTASSLTLNNDATVSAEGSYTTNGNRALTILGGGTLRLEESLSTAGLANGTSTADVIQHGTWVINRTTDTGTQTVNVEGVSAASFGTLAGTGIINREVILTTEHATVFVGDPLATDRGTFTLNQGLDATSGGHFVFGLGGTGTNSGNDLLVINSTFDFGTATLTADFLDFGLNPIVQNTAYTVLIASGLDAANWEFGELPVGWEGSHFQVSGNELQVVFGVIPEPSTYALVTLGLGFLFLRRRLAHQRS